MQPNEQKGDDPKPVVLKHRSQALAILRKFTGKSAVFLSTEHADAETPDLLKMANSILIDRKKSENLVITEPMMQDFVKEYKEEKTQPPKNPKKPNPKLNFADLLGRKRVLN